MTYEDLLRVWLDKEPTAKSPYGLYGYPDMWEIHDNGGGLKLFARPGRAYEGTPVDRVEVDGVHYQWRKDGEWAGQGYCASIAWFTRNFRRIQQEGP